MCLFVKSGRTKDCVQFILNDEFAVDIPVRSVSCYARRSSGKTVPASHRRLAGYVYVVRSCNVCYLLFTHSWISILVFIDFTHHFPELIWLYAVCGTYLLAKPSKLINYMTFLLFFPIFLKVRMGLIVSRFWNTHTLHAIISCAQAE